MKNKYTAPELTIVQFRTERGFAASLNNVVGNLHELDELWQIDQEVMGLNTNSNAGSEAGLAAGNFSQGDIGGWGLQYDNGTYF